MKTYPSVPHLDEASNPLEGHLWLQELLDGAHLRFQLRESGVIRFGDREGVFHGDVPLAYGHAVRHVREAFDREALRSAVDDVESVVFYAEAMHRQAVDYEFERTPSVLGFDVFDADREQFLPPDRVESVFERLGLQPVNTFRKELRASEFRADPSSIPESAWYDGPAAGVFVRDKTGGRAKLPNPAVDTEADPEPLEGTAEEVADRYVTDVRLRRIAERVETRGQPADFDALFDRVFEDVLREIHGRLLHPRSSVEIGEFRSAVAAETREWLDGGT